jgi:hypothetical protein
MGSEMDVIVTMNRIMNVVFKVLSEQIVGAS